MLLKISICCRYFINAWTENETDPNQPCHHTLCWKEKDLTCCCRGRSWLCTQSANIESFRLLSN